LGKPPPTIALVLKAACIMVGKPVKKLPSKEDPKVVIDDWWATSVAWMSNTNKFLADLTTNFKPDAINPDIIDKIKELFIGNPEFTPARVAKANKACEGLCKWIIKLVDYDKLIRHIRPLKQAMGDAIHDWNNCMTELNIKRQELAFVERQFEQMQERFTIKKEEMEVLEEKIIDVQLKIQRADKLLDGLSGEKERWVE
jgi:dynein heavy chain, axonemal